MSTESGEQTHVETSTDLELFQSEDLQVFHLRRTVSSTQDEAKRLLDIHRQNDGINRSLAVIADNQRQGRGTNGRTWVAREGNLFLTCAISTNSVPLSKITLLPLGVGVIIAEKLAEYTLVRPVVKWPNDVLVDGKKIAGVLIETYRVGQHDYWLVGIGVNLESSPENLPPEHADFRSTPRSPTSVRNVSKVVELPAAHNLGVTIATGLQLLINDLKNDPTADSVIAAWKSWADLGSTYEIRATGEKVRTTNLETDGRLRVVGQNGTERLLVADYLF